MKITEIHAQNVFGIKSAEVYLDRPVAMFCGPNGAGKSSLRDAIALALTGDLVRVKSKQKAEVIFGDADAASCEVRDSDGDEFAVTIARSGKITDNRKGRETDPILPYVLDAQRFLRLEDLKERRSFLFGLMGLRMSTDAIKARLVARGIDMARAERVIPLLRGGFDAAAGEAKKKATEGKGAWAAITGEEWGSKKAIEWAAKPVAFDPADLAKASKALADADEVIADLQKQVGAMDAELASRRNLQAQLEAARPKAELLPRVRTKLQTDEASLKETEAALAQAQALAGTGPRVGLVHDLAAALSAVVGFAADEDFRAHEDALAALQAYEREHGKVGRAAGDPDAAARIPSLQQAIAMQQRTIENDRRDLAAAEAAEAQVKLLTEQLGAVHPVDLDGEKVRKELATAQLARKALAHDAAQLDTAKVASETVAKRTAEAAEIHAGITAWLAIAEALDSNGIPSDMLAEALGPINERLAQSAADTDWPVVEISPEMAITYGGRAEYLLSKSELWRAGAMVAEAISHLSGALLLVLDEFDILDLAGRAEALGWFDVLAETGEVATVLLFATLKQPPTTLPDTVAAFWVSDGEVQAVAREEATA